MLIGIAIGLVVGIMPGLGSGTALVLMFPFVFRMEPVQAFAFLLGMASVVSTAGDLTSILFGIPGESDCAASVIDGHPLAKQGQAGRAMAASLMSSLIGAIFGGMVLVLAVPLVRPLVLSFGAAGMFMMGMLGITFIATLSGGDMLKGLIAGGLGLLLAMAGLDTYTATPRYTFGLYYLWDGVPLVPVTIGLFAIPEVIDLAIKGGSIAQIELDENQRCDAKESRTASDTGCWFSDVVLSAPSSESCRVWGAESVSFSRMLMPSRVQKIRNASARAP